MTHTKLTFSCRMIAALSGVMALLLCAQLAWTADFSAKMLKGAHYRNEPVRFSIHCSEMSHIYALRLSAGNVSNLVFPNLENRDNICRSGGEFLISLPHAGGKEFVLVATTSVAMAGQSSTADHLNAIAGLIKDGQTDHVFIKRFPIQTIDTVSPACLKDEPLTQKQTSVHTSLIPDVLLTISLSSFTTSANDWTSVDVSSSKDGVIALYLEMPSGELYLLAEILVYADKNYAHNFMVGDSGSYKLHLAWAKEAIFLPSISMEELPQARNTKTISFMVR